MTALITDKEIMTALDAIAKRDRHVREAILQVGYPAPRNRPMGFETLMGIIVGQQVSTAAGNAIRGRLAEAVAPLTPEQYLATHEDALRAAGLSARKVDYGRGLAEAMCDGELCDDDLHTLDDHDVIKEITAIRGLGRWSAEIYLMFAMKRPDVWPAEDLAVAEALRRLKGLDERPDRKTSEALVEPWRPYRSFGALFLWHYYQGAPT